VARELQLIGYLRLFAECEVEYLIVGGVGARLQGAATTTQDVDIMPEPSPANLQRLARALSDRSTEKKELDSTEYSEHAVVDPTEFRTNDVCSLRTKFGVIDVLMDLPGVGGFDVVRRNARRYDWNETTLWVAAIDDIITSKEVADRAKDRRALDALYEARDHLREHPDAYELPNDALDVEELDSEE
jgi:hypothetical protein